MRRLTKVIGACALLAGTALPFTGDATAVSPARFVSGWIPNWSSSVATDGTRALNAGQGNEAVFAEVSPFGFSAVGAAAINVSGAEASLTTVVSTLRSRGLPVLPSITDGTGKLVMAGILADPASRAEHVAAITALVTSRGYDGIDLDYEGFAFTDGRSTWATTRPNWAQFIADLGTALHAQGKLLSVTVPPIWDGGASGYTVYAWPEMLPHLDRMRLMVYDWSVSQAGPISPISWVNNVLAYVQTVVPAEQRSKVQIGVPTYGRSWAAVTSGACPANAPLGTISIQMENAAASAAAHGATPARDASGEMRFTYDQTFTGSRTATITAPTYTPPTTRTNNVATADPSGLAPALRLNPGGGTVTCTVRRTVYYPDVVSVIQRANAAVAAGMSGIAIWALGYETTDLWAYLQGVDAPRRAGTAPDGRIDSATIGADSVAVAGWVLDPEFDLPATFTVSVTNPGQPLQMSGPIIARELRPDLGGPSMTHGFNVGVAIPTQPGAEVCIHARGWGASASSSVEVDCHTFPV
jgi:spore germination protein YaaH